MKRGFWYDFRRAYRGTYGWAAWVVQVYMSAFTLLALWFYFEAVEAESTRNQILYSAGALAWLIMLAADKIWFWSLVHRNALEDRLKRIEEKLSSSQ